MSHHSPPELLVLHAVRVLGFAESDDIAAHARTSHPEALRLLTQARQAGWVQYGGFADLYGWSLTEGGKAENERQLAVERDIVDFAGVVVGVYDRFLPLNARLLVAVTDWQIRPTVDDQFATNDHSDQVWDGRILDELTALSRELTPLGAQLTALFARFDGYVERYDSALAKAKDGDPDWVDKTDRDSCHRVWFQLHEDLIATLGIRR